MRTDKMLAIFIVCKNCHNVGLQPRVIAGSCLPDVIRVRIVPCIRDSLTKCWDVWCVI